MSYFFNKIKKFSTIKLIIFIFLSCSLCIFTEGFIAGTKIKTPEGYKSIEKLDQNDCVTSYDFINKSIVKNKILKIKKNKYLKAIVITINNYQIIVAPDHKFFCPLNEKNKWVKAKNLQSNDVILSNLKECIKIENIREYSKEADFYSLSIDKTHNYFISEENILVHNFVWWVPVFEIVIGGGFKWLLSTSAIASAIAGIAIVNIAKNNGVETSGLGNSYNYSNNSFDSDHASFNKKFKEVEEFTPNKRKHIFENKDHGFSGGPNDKDPDKWYEIIKNRLKKAYAFNEIKDGENYEVRMPQIENPEFGDLIIRGVVQSTLIRIGTAFLEKK